MIVSTIGIKGSYFAKICTNFVKIVIFGRKLFSVCSLIYSTNGGTFYFPSSSSHARFGPYFVEPIVVGIDPVNNEPFVGGLDVIGCIMETEEFVVAGSCTEQMYGMCETLWEKDMVSRVWVSLFFFGHFFY